MIWLFGTTGHHSVMYKFHYYKAKTHDKPSIGENTNMLNTNWTQHRTDFQKFLPHIGRTFHWNALTSTTRSIVIGRPRMKSWKTKDVHKPIFWNEPFLETMMVLLISPCIKTTSANCLSAALVLYSRYCWWHDGFCVLDAGATVGS